MPALQSVYMMAFTPKKMETNILMSVCRMAADRLAAKDKTFAQCMSMLALACTRHNQVSPPLFQRKTGTGGILINR